MKLKVRDGDGMIFQVTVVVDICFQLFLNVITHAKKIHNFYNIGLFGLKCTSIDSL